MKTPQQKLRNWAKKNDLAMMSLESMLVAIRRCGYDSDLGGGFDGYYATIWKSSEAGQHIGKASSPSVAFRRAIQSAIKGE